MEHIVIRNHNLFCTNCGGEFKMKFPVAVDDMTAKMNLFEQLHADCEKTWTEPVADQNGSTEKKAMWWMASGETGTSSKAMWNCFMGNKTGDDSHPHDPDDFKRCYKLLIAVPEWKNEMHKLKSLSPVWERLVNNWDKLTDMYEQNVRDNWINNKEIGMYQFMQQIIDNKL